MRKIIMLTTLLIIIFLNGCASQIEQPSIEDLGLFGVMGFDYVDENQMKVTISLPQKSNKIDEEVQFSAKVSLVNEAIMKLSTESDENLSPAQLRVILVSEEFARKRETGEIVKSLYRSPLVGDTVFVAVVKGSAEDMLKKKYRNRANVSKLFNDLLHPRQPTAFQPFTSIHDFIFSLTDNVADPVDRIRNTHIEIPKFSILSMKESSTALYRFNTG